MKEVLSWAINNEGKFDKEGFVGGNFTGGRKSPGTKHIEMGKHKLYSRSGKCLLLPPQGDLKFK